MLRIAICDDDMSLCSSLENNIIKIAENHGVKIHTEVFYNGEDLLRFIQNHHSFEIYFLDIIMKNINGIAISDIIRNKNKDILSEIIFISSTTQYDRQLFAYHPLRFLSKPLSASAVEEAFLLACQRYNLHEPAFSFCCHHENYRINYQNILFFESDSRKIKIITADDTFTYYGKFADLTESLPNFFCQIHRSYIINLHKVLKYGYGTVTLYNGFTINIGAAYRKNFIDTQLKLFQEQTSVTL